MVTALALGFAFFLLGVAVAGASLWIHARSSGRIYDDVAAVPPRRAALILGASVRPDRRPTLTLRNRLQVGLDLLRAGKVERLIVSGDHGAASYDEPNVMHRWLLEHGAPVEAVFIDHAGFRTLDSVARAQLVFGAAGVVICSQRFHLPRAIFLARHWDLDAVGLVAPPSRRHRAFNALRETAARARAVIDVYGLGLGPRFAGSPIDLEGPASQTHDRQTQIPRGDTGRP